jgi:hypothetical protein
MIPTLQHSNILYTCTGEHVLEAVIPTKPAIHSIFPALRSSERDEIRQLSEAMNYFIEKLNSTKNNQNMNMNMGGAGVGVGGGDSNKQMDPLDHLVSMAKEEQAMFDLFFQEIIRQVSIQCKPRGDLLLRLRNHYAALFKQIPKYASLIQSELSTQRKLTDTMAAGNV